ncbi:MAG TPA: AAA family ATPase [Stellaceae bacterium]|nr:AAA family ATPase [Stellaceae bacterium]
MECLHCGNSLLGGNRFCGQCGAPAPVDCSACGARNPPNRNFCGNCGTSLGGLPPVRGIDSAPAAAVERRQLTVLFCDLVNSMPLSLRLDPEDLRDVIAAYLACAADTVGRLGGFVAQYIGDGVLAYFGYPRAHEDDAERAARVGLALIEAVGGLKTKPDLRLQVRVGIATGLAIVGDVLDGRGTDRGGVGEVLNLAARLQAFAAPGAVVVCGRTRRLVGRRFHYDDLGRVELKGFSEPVQAYRILCTSDVRSRFAAQHERPLTPLVGRDEELELLLRRWRNAAAGEGRVVLLSGEPGIGKSRLNRALNYWIAEEPHASLNHACTQHHASSTLLPVINQIARAADFAPDDGPMRKRRKLEALLAQTHADEADVEVLAELLSLPHGRRGPTPDSSPQRRKERILEALLRQLHRLTEQKPVLMVFEDVHWLDPTSLEMLTLIVERAARWRILVVLTARPEFTAPWPAYAHVTTLSLNRLDQRHGAALVEMVTKGKALPPAMLDQILSRADGVPLFIEELTKAMLESALMREDSGRYVLVGAVPAAAIPATLHASLLARLDRDTSAREVAQIAAAIGREFSYSLVSAVAGLPEHKLRNALDELARSELVFRRGELPGTLYTFKHALVRDVAYGTMLRSRRQQLHARIAQAFRADPVVAEGRPELVADHLAEAGQSVEAVQWWLKAGQIALTRSANFEATAHLRRALGLVETWPHGEARDQQELELLSMLATALVATQGYAAEQTVSAYERGRKLIHVTGDRTRQDAIFSGLFVAYYNLGDFEKGLDVGREFLKWAQTSGDPLALCIGHRTIAASHNACGDFAAAARHGEAAAQHYDAEQHAPLAWRFIHDVGVAAACHWAVALWHRGNLRRAAEVMRKTMAHAARLNHRNTIGYALFYAGLAAFRSGNVAALSDHAAQLQTLGREYNLPHWLAWGLCFECPALLAGGDAAAAVAKIDEAILLSERLRVLVYRPMLLGLRAEALAATGRSDDALQAIDNALATAERTGERAHDAELWRLKGSIALAEDHRGASTAEDSFDRALRHARAQGSAMFELRASVALASLWSCRGKVSDAAALLARACGGIAEHVECRDLREANALLRELGGRGSERLILVGCEPERQASAWTPRRLHGT